MYSCYVLIKNLRILERVIFRAGKFIRDSEGHHIMIKGLILQENSILSLYLPYSKASEYMK